jgi:hypothetical protein
MGYFGTAGHDEGIGITVDPSGNAYVTGTSYTGDLAPSPPPADLSSYFDAFVTKFALNPDGVVPCGNPEVASDL